MLTNKLFALAVMTAAGGSVLFSQTVSQPGRVSKNGVEFDVRSHGRALADDAIANASLPALEEVSPAPGVGVVPQIQFRGGNVQVNDGNLDNIQVFAGFRPFIKYTQSETSIAASGRNIVAVYNSSANQPQTSATVFTQRFFSGFSNSNDGGKTWTSGFIPPVPGSIFTFGDPVAGVDRQGNFYFAGLGANAAGASTIQVNKSTNGGRTWSAASIVQVDSGGDKEWMAIGPDPQAKNRDNVYVTWTSFQSTGAQLRFGRSTDGGATWTSKTIFAPAASAIAVNPQNSLQFSNPYVDPITGRLYVPFLHFSNADADFIRILASDDAGETFSFLNFNIAGAPLPSLLPIVQPGSLIDCGSSGGLRLAIHAGANIGGRFGFPSFVQASRLVVQPAFAARNGVLYLAWSNSTSPVFGTLNSQSNVRFIRSNDSGQTWSAPVQVNPAVATDIHHVLPSLAIDSDPNDVHIAYYTQHSDGTVDFDMANSRDKGASFLSNRTVRVTGNRFVLPPTNIRLAPPSGGTYNTTNYDRLVRPCYCLGEYVGVTSANGSVYALWGGAENTVTHPVNALDPLSGVTHTQQDVYFQEVKAQ